VSVVSGAAEVAVYPDEPLMLCANQYCLHSDDVDGRNHVRIAVYGAVGESET